jgi:hypothetical protein
MVAEKTGTTVFSEASPFDGNYQIAPCHGLGHHSKCTCTIPACGYTICLLTKDCTTEVSVVCRLPAGHKGKHIGQPMWIQE